jgi:BatD DUF11 like domain
MNSRALREARIRTIAFAIAVAITALPAAPAVTLAATELTARASQTDVPDGATFDLLLSAAGDPPSAAPDLSVLERDFEILGRRQTQRVAVVNGRADTSFDWIVTLAPRRAGSLTIPAIRAGDASTSPLTITVGAAPSAPSSGGRAASDPAATAAPRAGADLFVEASVDQDAPVVQGEVRYTVRVYDGVGIRDGALTEPAGDQLLFTPVGDARSYEKTVGGRPYRVYEREFHVAPQASGELMIPPVTLQARVPTPRAQGRGRSPFDDSMGDAFFDDAFAGMAGRFGFGSALLEQMMAGGGRQVRVRSNPITLHVKPRPTEAGSEWFLPARAVELQETWTPSRPSFRVGEAVARTITLRALGSSAEQLPRFEIPAPDGARQYPEGARDGSLPTGEGTIAVLEQTVSLVPTSAGRLMLPAVEVRWWDIAAEEMRTARLPEETFDVLPAAGEASSEHPQPDALSSGPAPTSASGSAERSADAAISSSTPNATDAAPPSAAARPHSGAVAFGAAVLVPLLLVGAWLTLRRRARAAAPPTHGSTRPAASPARSLAAVRAACRSGDAAGTRSALLAWARATWPAAPPRNTAEIGARLATTPGLTTALATLDAQLFGRSAEPWNGEDLWTALSAATTGAPSAAAAAGALPPLYPAAVERAA